MKFLIKKTPDRFIRSVNDEIASILNRNFDSLFPEFIYNQNDEEQKFAMPVELHEKDDAYCIKAELPGIKKEDLDIEIDKNHITINAKKEEENSEEAKNCRKSEFRYGDFSRTVYFPADINIEQTNAKLEHGILKIVAPKVEKDEEKTRKLEIE